MAHPQHDIPHETSYEVPHEIKESVKLADDWINLIEHEKGSTHISDELRKNQMIHGGVAMPLHHQVRPHRPVDEPEHPHLMMKRGLSRRPAFPSQIWNNPKRVENRNKEVAMSNYVEQRPLLKRKKRVLMDHYDKIQVDNKGNIIIIFTNYLI